MTAKQFTECFQIAQNREYNTCKNLEDESFTVFDGFYLHKERRIATKEQVAYIINYQCRYLNGSYDMAELQTMKEVCRRIDLLN